MVPDENPARKLAAPLDPSIALVASRILRQGSYPKDFEGELVKKVLAAVEK